MPQAWIHTDGRSRRTVRQGGDIPKLNTLHLEIDSLFVQPRARSELISGADFQWKKTRCYTCAVSGPQSGAESFLRRLLLNPQAEKMHINAAPAVNPHVCFIDVRIRPGHLDLEREYILRYCRHGAPTDVEIADIKPCQRIYLLDGDIPDMNRILRHLVNPVIHEWEVIHA